MYVRRNIDDDVLLCQAREVQVGVRVHQILANTQRRIFPSIQPERYFRRVPQLAQEPFQKKSKHFAMMQECCTLNRTTQDI